MRHDALHGPKVGKFGSQGLAIVAVVSLLVANFGCSGAPVAPRSAPDAAKTPPPAAASSETRREAPDLVGDVLDGERLALRDYRGRVLVLDFMASWCQTCVETMPRWRALAAQLHGRGATIVLVSQDEDEDALRRLIAKAEVREPVVVDRGEVWWNAFALRYLPTAVVIGADGRVAGSVRDLADGGFETLRTLIEAELRRATTNDGGLPQPPRPRRPDDRPGS